MSSAAESLRHHLLQVDTDEQDPEAVDETHDETVTHRVVVILREQVVSV